MFLNNLAYKSKFVLIFCLLIAQSLSAQIPVKCLSVRNGQLLCDTGEFHLKVIPKEIHSATLLALSYYPELVGHKIAFRFRNKITPLSSRPCLFSLFVQREKRTYIITISRKTTKQISPILFANLPFNAQVGVIGHELAHIIEFSQKSSWQLVTLFFKNLKSSNTDRFEFNTDRVCIEHGLGYQLYDWSAFVRVALQIREWKGVTFDGDTAQVNQRYMNPPTIHRFMQKNGMYNNIGD